MVLVYQDDNHGYILTFCQYYGRFNSNISRTLIKKSIRMKRKMLSLVIAIVAITNWASAQTPTPNVFIDSTATYENYTLTDSSLVVYGKGGVNINPATSNLVGRFYTESEDGMHRSDTTYYEGNTIPMPHYVEGLYENETNGYIIVGQVADTTGGTDSVYSEVSTYAISGTTMWEHDQPIISGIVLLEALQTSLNIRTSLDAHAGAYVRYWYYDIAVGPGSAQWSAGSAYVQGPNAEADLSIFGLLPGNSYWVQAYAEDQLINESSAFVPDTFTTTLPELPTGSVSDGGSNVDSVLVCFDAQSNDLTGSVTLEYVVGVDTILASTYAFADSTDGCQWIPIWTSETPVTAVLTVNNSLGDPQVYTANLATTGYDNPILSIDTIVVLDWYNSVVYVDATVFGGGGNVSVYVPGLGTFPGGTVPQGPSTGLAIPISGTVVNTSYAVQVTLTQNVDSQTETVNRVFSTANADGPTATYTQQINTNSYTFCLDDVISQDSNGATVELIVQAALNGPVLLDTTFEWSGASCFALSGVFNTTYDWSIEITDTVGQYQDGGSFAIAGPGVLPQINMGNGFYDPITGWVQISYWCNPDISNPAATADTRVKIGLNPQVINVPVATENITGATNSSLSFDGDPYRQIGQTVIVWFTMDATNSSGGYSEAQFNNFFTLPALPDTIVPPVQLFGPVVVNLDTLSVDSTGAVVGFQGEANDSLNTMYRINYNYDNMAFSTAPSAMSQTWGSYLVNLNPLLSGRLVFWQVELSNQYGVFQSSSWEQFTTDEGPVILPPDPLEGPVVMNLDTLSVDSTAATVGFEGAANDSLNTMYSVNYSYNSMTFSTPPSVMSPTWGNYLANLNPLPVGTLVSWQVELSNQYGMFYQSSWEQFTTDEGPVIVVVNPVILNSDTLVVDSTSATLVSNIVMGDWIGLFHDYKYTVQGQVMYSAQQSIPLDGLYTTSLNGLPAGSTCLYQARLLDGLGNVMVLGPIQQFITDLGPVVVVEPPVPMITNSDTVSVGINTAMLTFVLTNGNLPGVSFRVEYEFMNNTLNSTFQSVSSQGVYTQGLSGLSAGEFVSARGILYDNSGDLYTGPWLYFTTDEGPITPPEPVDSVVVYDGPYTLIYHNAASVSWYVDINGVEDVELYVGYGQLTPNENFTPVQDGILDGEYLFAMEELNSATLYFFKMFVKVGGGLYPATTETYLLETEPNGIKEILSRSPNASGKVVDISGRELSRNLVKLNDIVRGDVTFGRQIVVWTGSNDEGSVKILSH
ncbi:MAG: hypothetical protein ACI88L_000189 [Candidatus Paceibacteria bacterium]|jgi:hypothetical protein